METDVMVPDQYDQFCVGVVPEHPVEATHIVLPVLQGETTQFKQVPPQVSIKEIK